MKKFGVVLGIAYVCLLLGGCGKSDCKELLMNTYEEWLSMNMRVWVVGAQTGGENLDLFDEGTEIYNQVIDENLNSLEKIQKETESICTKQGAKTIFYDIFLNQEKIYAEKDGVLYRKMVEIPASYGGELKEIKVIKEKPNFIHAKMEFYYNFDEPNYLIEMKIIKQADKWLVDELKQTYLTY